MFATFVTKNGYLKGETGKNKRLRDLRIKCASKNATQNEDFKGKTVMGDRVAPIFGVRFGDHLGIILNQAFFSSGLGIMF